MGMPEGKSIRCRGMLKAKSREVLDVTDYLCQALDIISLLRRCEEFESSEEESSRRRHVHFKKLHKRIGRTAQ